ncbi:universal stress protein [Streptomyces sp. F63]|uniref:universal stress protein n=1 Tax=Streptomyces sp. F63 TaxID=2824887 RepID=UPI001B3747DB|nr:universal stress protein [Streptomyces sp. F63]MBQ0988120.1 universal stress protein [Streptomyces sp. F63]
MNGIVTAGLDGSPESAAAAEWAAREALLRGVPLRLVHAREKEPHLVQAPFVGTETQHEWTGGIPDEAVTALRERHPGLEITAEDVTGRPREVLQGIARSADLLVLGSRGLGGVAGFLVGSVALATVAHATRPTVLVRAGEAAGDGHRAGPDGHSATPAPFRDVVLGLDLHQPCDALIRFAFEAAARRAARLRVVHSYRLPPAETWGSRPAAGAYPPTTADLVPTAADFSRYEERALTAALAPWRADFPEVEVAEECGVGGAAHHLTQASAEASLVVVGRRIRRSPLGTHIGAVAHALLHHSAAPVAVVPHD